MTPEELRNIAILSDRDRRRLQRKLTNIGLGVLVNTHGPMPLWRFSERLAVVAGVRVAPDVGRLSDAIKLLLWRGNKGRLRIIATSMPGVGYVIDRDNPETWPTGVDGIGRHAE